MQLSFLLTLDRIREDYGSPLYVTSGWRCPDYNDEISSTGRSGPHTTGRAADIHVYGAEVSKLLPLLVKNGVTGIGLKQHGDHSSRFLHVDTLDALATRPRPWVWTYP